MNALTIIWLFVQEVFIAYFIWLSASSVVGAFLSGDYGNDQERDYRVEMCLVSFLVFFFFFPFLAWEE